MSDLTKPVDLNIPEEAIELIVELDAVEAGIRLAIAAELDRLADWYWLPTDDPSSLSPGINTMCALLSDRAAKLRGE
jgi:hypothetical protein